MLIYGTRENELFYVKNCDIYCKLVSKDGIDFTWMKYKDILLKTKISEKTNRQYILIDENFKGENNG